jgi:N-acetylglucosaminyl-diphospho-decaprenol L-rhamnosyltransferase
MDLSIIFVNWNSLSYLEKCVSSIYSNTRNVEFEIIVVDNASPEGGVQKLKELFPGIVIIESATNLGFAGANNLGCRNSSGRYVLFLNPDTLLVGPTINTMLSSIKSLPDAGIVGCKMLNTDLSIQITSIQKFPTILNQVLNAEFLQLRWPNCSLWAIGPLFTQNTKPVKVEVIPGACMLLRREVFNEVGMFSEEYFMYAEDLDLNYKLAKQGYSNYYVGDAVIVHHGGRSSSKQAVSQWSTIMKYRAMTRYYRKTRGRLYEIAYRMAMGCVALGRLALITLMYPLGNIIWKKEALRNASRKWRAVLKWAIDRHRLIVQ